MYRPQFYRQRWCLKLAVKGTIENDGTFQVTSGTAGGATAGTIYLSITGRSPSPSTPSAWTGAYSLVYSSPSSQGCSIAQSGTFAATPIAPLTGTYIGTLASNAPTPGPFGSAATVSAQIAQGEVTLVTQGSTTRYLIPLTATLTIANSPCSLAGSTADTLTTSSIRGDSFVLALLPGSFEGVLSGTLDDATANTFFGDLTSLARVNGCPGIAFYHFTRK